MSAFLRNCRASGSRTKCSDSTGSTATGSELVLKSLIFRRLLAREVLGKDEKYVGLLLPPSVGSVLANVALPLDGRIAVNLNYTVSTEIMDSCIKQCDIKHVLTSRKVTSRLSHLKINAEVVYLEDLISKVKLSDKIAAAFQAYAMPIGMLEWWLGVDKIKPEDLLTVLFTSGSTGEPKGVMLSHRNVGTNILAIDDVINLTEEDVALGVLPFFHSYGYTATLWTVLALNPSAIYHFNPLEAQIVGNLCRKHRVTILISTPTFLRAYLRRCEPEDMQWVDVIFASAEKLPTELSDAFEQKFGKRPSEAYGATEMSPLIAVNVPPTRCHETEGIYAKDETVGRPIPGLEAKTVDPDTGEDLEQGDPGMLLLRGPNVMMGYMNQPEKTAEVIRDGWYVTGDIALIDDDGFIHITGRINRFSKIGGEMVPHIKIEDRIKQILKSGEEELKAVVTAVPDKKRGERIVVVHLPLDLSPQEICKQLGETDLPNLWIPSTDSFLEVDEIPVLGTGKLDLKGLRDVALEHFSETVAG